MCGEVLLIIFWTRSPSFQCSGKNGAMNWGKAGKLFGGAVLGVIKELV